MNKIKIFEEPTLQFADGQELIHPRDGLSLFGPYDSLGIGNSRTLTYGAIGTRSGLDSFSRFMQAMVQPIETPVELDETLWPHYPGFEAAFNAKYPHKPTWEFVLDEEKLRVAASLADESARVFSVVNFYMDAIRIAKKTDNSFHCIFCIVPEFIHKNCRPKSVVKDGVGKRLGSRQRKSRSVMGDFFESYDSKQFWYSIDFRRQIKARSMESEIPIQIILEPTLTLKHDANTPSELTPLSDRAWNLSTTFYYKSGGKPWKLSSVRDGVCYIGIAFKDTEDRGLNACCAAQMFLDDGDGIVFLGDEGRWYTERRGEYHLTRDAARRLLTGTLKTYSDLHGKQLTEIFLHSRSKISDEEFSGYQEACPSGAKLVTVRVAPERMGLRLYRMGTRPVLRGTFWQVSDKRGFLWGSGFKPRLKTYDGSEVPQPLFLEVQHGEANVEQVARDILGLSKLNYNACKLGEREPVTIGFSDSVGEILVTNRKLEKILPNFKYYI